MATTTAPYLYTEARLNLDAPYAGSTIGFTLPPHSSAPFLSRPRGQRAVVDDGYPSSNEVSFARRHLASSDASIFFRRKHPYPRSFLWRILDDRKVLEVRSVDLSIDPEHKGEAILTLLLSFPNAIRPYGVALAEPGERDALNIFVVTTANELYTLNLHKDFFIRTAATEIDVEDWCKTFVPSAFSFRYPYRLVAASAEDLWVSLHDGGLLRLTREAGDDGSSWRETFYSEGGWGSAIKTFIPFRTHRTIQFGNLELEASTAAAIHLAPTETHIWTVSLNHALKAWNLSTGRIGVQTDLLGDNDREPQKMSQYFIGASQRQLMQICVVPGAPDGDLYYVVTYSPKRHQFKFWGIRDEEDTQYGLHDMQPDLAFVPPVDELMNTTVWNMEEFCIKPGHGWRDTEIWIRVRSGPNCKVYSVKLNLLDTVDQLRETWRNHWVALDSGSLTIDGLKSSPRYPKEPDPYEALMHNKTSTEQWIEFLFYPGRFTTASLEASYNIYRRGMDQSFETLNGDSKAPLKDRLCSAVAKNVTFAKTHKGEIDHDTYEIQTNTQWHNFYAILRDLHKRRGEAVALVLDYAEGLPWVLLSDYAAPVRQCSEIEILRLNSDILTSPEPPSPSKPIFKHLQDEQSMDVAKLLNAARQFRSNLDPSLEPALDIAVASEILQDASLSVPDRMDAFEARCDLYSQVTDDDVDRLDGLMDDLGGFAALSTELFLATLGRLEEEERGFNRRLAVTGYGAKALIRGVQDTLELTSEVLLDLLVLVVFVHRELDPSDLPNFDTLEAYAELMTRLKGIAISLWLASTMRTVPPRRKRLSISNAGDSFSSMTSTTSQDPVEISTPTVTMFESLFIGDASDLQFPDIPTPARLTYWCRAWTFGMPLPENYDFISTGVMTYILKNGNLELASEFLRFLPSTAWGTYLRARYYLATGGYSYAATYFKKAAYGLADLHTGVGWFDIEQNDSHGYLSPEQRDSMSDGMHRYYQHVMLLYEKAKAYSYMADFARSALQANSIKMRMSPGGDFQTEMLSKLFNACIHTSRFSEAYNALSRQTNPILRQSNLTTLIKTTIAQSQTQLLFSLPFTTLSNDVDSILAKFCKETLNIATAPSYHKFLYSYRISRNDFRGAASILYERLQRLETSSVALNDSNNESVAQCYLLLINTLASVDPEQAWILAEQKVNDRPVKGGLFQGGPAVVKRRVLTIEDIRKEYQRELDRMAAMENGRFAFNAEADDMDVL
ncbi:hypothetical protein K490DRAFT_72530 [Saccharata proteae CBS 121410]|uniref:Nucleoporin Nup120/160 n=1 Tax=Saccharata proteae CBS 121410 TaxID=1314787 RepID=A0A6A5YAU4_9PEZI|nr:hypothetical protein K490DRAFT_72530 [Saccharata proteae CBS 121410]